MTKNYRIRIYLSTPLLYSVYRPIRSIQGDGLYGYAWMLQEGIKKNASEQNPENIIEPVLPFVKENDCYCISAGFFPKNAYFEGTLLMRSMNSTAYAKQNVGESIVNFQMGEHQSVMDFYWKLITPYIDFYAKCDNIEKFKALTKIIYDNGYISNKRSVGFGRILNIKINEIDYDWSQWKDGQPTRNIPIANKKKGNIVTEYCGYKPPYWHTDFWTECFVPPVDMHMPNIPEKTPETSYNLRKVYYRNMANKISEYLKKDLLFIPHIRKIIPDMSIAQSGKDINYFINRKFNNDELIKVLTREYSYIPIFLLISKKENDEKVDLETDSRLYINRLSNLIKQYLSTERHCPIEQYIIENVVDVE